MSYHAHVIQETEENSFFRKVVFTGEKSQLVLMAIPAGEEIGEEVHEHVEQTLFFHEGSGTVYLDDVSYPVIAGDVVVVTPGAKHNVINTGQVPLKIYTVYTPPNHLKDIVHKTKADADADIKNEEFGHSIR